MVASTLTRREVDGRAALDVCGWDISPEFGAALWPRPREKWVGGGWQAGKSVEGHAEILIRVEERFHVLDFRSAEQNLYRGWVIVPSYKAPKLEMDYLLQSLSLLGYATKHDFNDGGPSRIELWDGRGIIETRTAQDPEGIAGEPCDDVLVVEAGQMPEIIRTQCQGRIITRRGNITYTGTLEDEEAKPRYVWYGKALAEYSESPTGDCGGYSLPSWANRTVFPGGRNDPEIIRQEAILGPHAFQRRIAGKASGSQYPVYPMLGQVPQFYTSYGVPGGHDRWIYSMGAGGHDFGKEHPSTLAVLTVNDLAEAWVREVRWMTGYSTKWRDQNIREMVPLYRVPMSRWGFDPMQKEAAADQGAESTGPGSRPEKVRLIEARLGTRKLMFDLNGPGVAQAFAQMQRVHYIKRSSPEKGEFLSYHRSDDDLAAAIENAVHVIDDGRPAVDLGALTGLSQRAPTRAIGGLR